MAVIDIGRWVRDRPDGLAIVDGASTWTWAELDGHASRGAAGLAAISGPVALAVPPTGASVAAIHAAARAGIDVLLVNPRLTEAEIAGLRATAGAGALLDPAELSAGDPRLPAGRPTTFLVATSGTTTRPKLAELPVDRLVASASAWNDSLPPATGWLLSLGPEHVAGLGIVVRAALAGVAVVVPPSPGLDGRAVLAAFAAARERHGIVVSHLSLVAAQLAAVLDVTGDAPPPDGVRAVLLGGGPVRPELVQRARRVGWPVVVTYGQTETASGVVADGRPLPGLALRIADDGAIVVRGPMVFAGYRGDPTATAEALDADGWLRTGDLGHLDGDGALVIDGRTDDRIIRGGENIAPAEVEAALVDHPGVAEIAVVGVPDARLGAIPVAVLALAPGAAPTDDALRERARARLAGFKIPARFVRVPALPRTSLGKVGRAEVERIAVAAERAHVVAADDGQPLAAWDAGPPDAPAVVLLHATMASAAHLAPLGRLLASDARVIRIDRRGSGSSAMAQPAPVPVERHVRDVLAVLDALGIGRAALVGHSFGGVVAIETARRFPERVRAVVAWEPPYVPVAPAAWRRLLARVGDAVAAGFAVGGPEGAARAFIESVGGAGAWASMPERQRAVIGRAGSGALADAAMVGLTGEGLGAITAPTLILTGEASEPFYRPIADALASRIGAAATRADVGGGLDHLAPGHTPAPISAAVRRHLSLPLDQEAAS